MHAIRLAAGLAVLGLLAACGPQAPQGIDKEKLDEAVSRAIGDPASCLLIAEQATGKQVYRYNTHTACDRKLPACDAPRQRTLDQLLEATLKDGKPRLLSCRSVSDASRWVGWASGAVAGPRGQPLVYAAMMEGDRAFPGRMMAERLEGRFQDVGLKPR
ncbi:MAG: hypothetical protein ACJ798_00315 [Phenylobacterium sp.]